MFKEADSWGCLVNTMQWNFLRSWVRESRRMVGHPSWSPIPRLQRPRVHHLLRLKTNDPPGTTPASSPNPTGLPQVDLRGLHVKLSRESNSSVQRVTAPAIHLPPTPLLSQASSWESVSLAFLKFKFSVSLN